jgi:hypothetical protein
MAPIAVQDSRPSQFVYAESANTEALRASWQRAIDDGADYAQIISWNDYSEMTAVAPSVHHGYAYLDINAYYQAAFQTGAVPAIEREAVFVTHRVQSHSAIPTYNHRLMTWWNGGTEPRDTVEVLTFLNAPASVDVIVGGTTTTYVAPAGDFAMVVPLSTGGVQAIVSRGRATVGVVSSPFTVQTAPYVQDLEYFAASNLRPNTR